VASVVVFWDLIIYVCKNRIFFATPLAGGSYKKNEILLHPWAEFLGIPLSLPLHLPLEYTPGVG